MEKIAKALGDINRLKIVEDMCRLGGTIQCSQIMELTELAQPSISHHIKTLIEAGLIDSEKEGRSHKYILNKSLLKDYVKSITLFATN